MFMETIYTPGVAHLSYILGDGGQAAVIDPRRDVDVYLRDRPARRGEDHAHLRDAPQRGLRDRLARTGPAHRGRDPPRQPTRLPVRQPGQGRR